MRSLDDKTEIIDLAIHNIPHSAVFLAPFGPETVVVKTFSDKRKAMASTQNNYLVGGMGFAVPEQSFTILNQKNFPSRIKEIHGWGSLAKLYTQSMTYLSGDSLEDYLKDASAEERQLCGHHLFNHVIPVLVGGLGHTDLKSTNLVIEKSGQKPADYTSYTVTEKFKFFDFEESVVGHDDIDNLTADLTDPVALVKMYQGEQEPHPVVKAAIGQLRGLFSEEEMRICPQTATAAISKHATIMKDNKDELSGKGLGHKADMIENRLSFVYQHFKART